MLPSPAMLPTWKCSVGTLVSSIHPPFLEGEEPRDVVASDHDACRAKEHVYGCGIARVMIVIG